MRSHTTAATAAVGRCGQSCGLGRIRLVQLLSVLVVLLAVTRASHAAATGRLAQRRSTQFGGPDVIPTYKCGSGSYEFGTVDFRFASEVLANVSTEATYNLTVLRFPDPAGPFPSDVPPAAEVIGSVRLIANSPAGSVTVEITNKFGQAWPAGTVVSWTSPLFYDVSRCAIGPERLQAETPLENILSPADAADGVKTIISFSLPWYRLSRPRISPFLGEEPCARPTQISALLVKVYLPPSGPGRRALQQSGSLGAYAGSVAWGGKSTCDVLFNGDNNSYYPFRLMDIELACDCFIDTPTCNTGDFELRTRLGALLPQPIDVNLLHFAGNVTSNDRQYIPELRGYGFISASGGVLRARLVTKDGSPWPLGSRFSWLATADDASAGAPPGFGGGPPGADAPPGEGGDAPPGEGTGPDPVCTMPSLIAPQPDLPNTIIVTDSSTTEILIEIPTSAININNQVPIDTPDCSGPFSFFKSFSAGAATLYIKAVFPTSTAGGRRRLAATSNSRGLLQTSPLDPDSVSYLGIDAVCTGPPVVWANRLSFKCGCPKSPPSPPSPPRPPPSPPRPPPPADSGFPFCRCSKRKLNVSPYRLAITSENYGLGTGGLGPDSQGVKYNQICFAVGPFARCNATTSPCCSMTVKKLELLIRPECRTESPRPVRAIIVNNHTTLSPTFSNHIGATGEEFTVLGVTKLDKVAPRADGSPIIDICFRLASNSACGFADGLCDGRGGDGCLYSVFSAEDSNCCPRGYLDLFFGRR
ncbi:hypothetical protein CHLRE_04g221450v5 [Chlamydomonas reinhardtii]|uniref:Pherophorin domain-containing protein n=1 Tax=Chlamydomonas reinhardtii TaxID=3055 RepID=A0A2K3DUA6_CHLRE|nr:uncharacterized protein CHLRE_04g221450v5 [Chlamydomonas reinhardtii]PNW84113.1 hypothetical protein CHLRE_04g221450v5 [Chlamydomonas reinhardtii]